MNLFNLVGKITLDKSEFNKAINETKDQTKEVADSSSKNIGVIATAAWVKIGEAVIKVASRIKNMALDIANYADSFSDMSAQYGIGVKSLQEFNYIASQSSTTIDQLMSTMTMMYNKAKSDADVFTKLGVSVRDANGNMKDMDTLFWEVKTALDNVENSGDKSALMLEAFGRNAMAVGEVLRKDTTELQSMAQRAKELGIVMDEQTIAKADKFNNQLAELKLRAKAAFADLIAGAEGAEEKFDRLIDDVMVILEKAEPLIYAIGEKLGEALLKGIWKAIKGGVKRVFTEGWGWMIGKGWLWGKDDEPSSSTNNLWDDRTIMSSNGYEISERSTKTIEIKVSADGTSAIDEQNAEIIAKHIVPYIDSSMGEI